MYYKRANNLLNTFFVESRIKMTVFAYLRVSGDRQDVQNQKLGVLDYCNQNNLVPVVEIEDMSSGATAWKNRGIGEIIESSTAKDVIVVAEVSRLARSTLQVLEILEKAAERQVSFHFVKSGIIMDGSLQSTITATILGLAAQIEREFISSRTKEALHKRKMNGVVLGRPKGSKSATVKLDSFRDQIIDYLKKGVSKRSIARIIDCSPSTLYSWLKREGITTKGRTIGQKTHSG